MVSVVAVLLMAAVYGRSMPFSGGNTWAPAGARAVVNAGTYIRTGS